MNPTELERVRQYASQQTRMYSHLLGNLVPLNADKVGGGRIGSIDPKMRKPNRVEGCI